VAKRLIKSTDKKLFGVAGGVAEYFDIDPTLVRVGFVVACICFAFLGLIAYAAFAILMPSPATALPGPSGDQPLGGAAEEDDRARQHRNLFGVGLIGIGVFIAITRFGFFSWVNWWLIVFALIGVGAVLLTRRSRAA